MPSSVANPCSGASDVAIEFTPTARRDILLAARQLRERFGEKTAASFRIRLESTLARLEGSPLSVAVLDFPPEGYPELRVAPVNRFDGRLVFYTPTDTGILVVRVMMAASDWMTELADE